LRSLFKRNQVEHDLSEELQFHLEQKTQQYMDAGLSAEEARRKARREFGGIELSKENAGTHAASATSETFCKTWALAFMAAVGTAATSLFRDCCVEHGGV